MSAANTTLMCSDYTELEGNDLPSGQEKMDVHGWQGVC